MSEAVPDDSEIPLRGAPSEGWRWQDNELSIIFEPIIGPAASAVYCHLTGKAFGNKVTYTLRGLAAEMKRSRNTIWRAMAVLKQIGMVRIRAGGGNQESECSLVDLKKLAVRLGATRDRRRASYVLPPCRADELREQIAVLLGMMQAKGTAKHSLQIASREDLAFQSGGNLLLLDSKRDANVPPERRQRSTGETQTRPHLIQQNTRTQNIPSPHPPSHEDEALETKNLPDENGPYELLKWARDRFNGVIDDMRSHLLDTSRPPSPRFVNGAAEWDNFRFNSLAVEVVSWRNEVLMLMLSANDPTAAKCGLEKYHRQWGTALLKWYSCEVQCEIQQSTRTWWKTK